MDNRISLVVLGVTSNHIQSGAYVLVLAEENGPRRIPIVIGQAEAQSIAIAFEGIRPPRPITHDLFVTFAHAFGVRLRQVLIYRFDDGIFYSQLTFADPDGREVVVDSRTSDAIAIAIRTGSPIVTTEKIMRATGFVIDDGTLTRANDTENDTGNSDDSDSAVYDRSRGYRTQTREFHNRGTRAHSREPYREGGLRGGRKNKRDSREKAPAEVRQRHLT